MSIGVSELSAADVAAVVGNNRNDGYGNNGMFGNDWAWIIILLLFGYGRNGFGGGFGGGYGAGTGAPCATQADLSAGFANSTILSSLDDIKLGQANAINYNNQGFAGLNTAILQGFHGVDNAVCTLGYQGAQHASNLSAQLASCCCDIERAIDGNTTSGVMNTNTLSRQISDCCCDLEKMNMQNRFDAQAYNCNTLQAIDKLGDRIIDYMVTEKTQALRDENQALRLAASQAKQNQYLIDQIKPCPIPAYITCNPYAASYGYGVNSGCGGCGTGSF